MYKILKKKLLAEDTYLLNIEAPRLSKTALPGQFLIIKAKEKSERVPLTIADYNPEKESVTVVLKTIGKSTHEIVSNKEGDYLVDVVGPLGVPANFLNLPKKELVEKKYMFVGGGVGIAPIYPQIKWLHKNGVEVDAIIGAKTKSMLILEEELKEICNLYVTTDDNSSEHQGLVTDYLRKLLEEGKSYDEIVAIGPLIMMKYVVEVAKQYNIPCTVSLNSMMVDGTGMCGAFRVSIGGETKFTCVDGPEFDGYLVNFEEAMKRQAMYNTVEGKKQLDAEEKSEGHECHIGGVVEEVRDKKKRIPVSELSVEVRKTNFQEVSLGYTPEEAILEAHRCIQCKNPQCVKGCPVSIDIPAFIKKVAEGNFEEAARIIDKDSALPAVCGRVCPQEIQCEGLCILGKKHDPIAIGKLERFVGDWSREHQLAFAVPTHKNGRKVAVVGSGPSGITCAKELLIIGYDVTVFEALHEYGGVLAYGIPSFRLPKGSVVKYEIENVSKLGAVFEKNVVVGKTVTIDSLMKDEGFEAVYVATGAGLPNFMSIPGENLNGVVSANEFLTRNNLLFAYKTGYNTPNYVGTKVAVVGGGNVAIDAARTALRLGADVEIVYRRSEAELPARSEEIHHARVEGVKFNLLTNPVEMIENEKGWVKAMKCVRMELGEPDKTGRRKPIEIPNSEFIIETDMVIMAIGTSPNPLITQTTPGLDTNHRSCIVINEDTGQTSREGIFAGGDVVSGSATVILAMGAGKRAAHAIDAYLRSK